MANKIDAMEQVKEEFKRHLQNSFIRGLSVGQKVIATVVLDYFEKNEADRDEKIKKLCERTVGMSMESLADLKNTFTEIFLVAEGEVVEKVAEMTVQKEEEGDGSKDTEGDAGSSGSDGESL